MAIEASVRGHYPKWVQRSAAWILKKLGWELGGRRPDDARCVIICYPHDTNWDLPIALCTAMALDIPVVYTMKKEWFFGPLDYFFRWTGGLPIDRSRASNVVNNIANELNSHDTMFLLIPPEGTRKKVDYWKMGFYWIALTAGVPILPAYVDYVNKRSGVGNPIPVGGNVAEDFEKIRSFYVGIVGRCGELPPKYMGEQGQELAKADAKALASPGQGMPAPAK